MNVAISGWYGNANIGDEAILHQLVSTLKKEYPNIEITVFSDTPQETIKKHGVNALPQSYITGNLKMINCLSKTDVLIVGGGSLITEYSNNLWMLRIFLCKLFGKKIITYGLGVGPIKNKMKRSYIKLALGKIDKILVRDMESKKNIADLGVLSDIRVTADPTLLIESSFVEKDTKNKSGYLIGVTTRSWKDNKHVKVTAKVLDELINNGNSIIFIPFRPTEDNKIFLQIKELMNNKRNVRTLNDTLTPEQMIARIGGLDLLIGMRLHSLIFAAKHGVPMVGISYDPKVRIFMNAVGQKSKILEFDKLTAADMLNKIDDALSNKHTIHNKLKHRIVRLTQQSSLNTKYLLDFIQRIN